MESRSELTKQYISEAFLFLLKKKDFDKISVQNIADRAGLSHMAYYRNFKSKDEILIYILDKITDDFIKNSKISFSPPIAENALQTLFEHLFKYIDLETLLLKHNKIHLLQAEFDKYFLYRACGEEDKYKRLYLSGGIFRVNYEWIKNGAKLSPKELAKLVGNLI